MNQKQKITLIVTAIVIGLMVLIPPYKAIGFKQRVYETGYGFLFSLPPYFTDRGTLIPSTVNASTLIVQIFGVLVIGGLIYLALRKD